MLGRDSLGFAKPPSLRMLGYRAPGWGKKILLASKTGTIGTFGISFVGMPTRWDLSSMGLELDGT